MNQEDLLKEFLQDDILEKKYDFSKEKAKNFKFDYSSIKIIEAIKFTITKIQNGESEDDISRQLNNFLNK